MTVWKQLVWFPLETVQVVSMQVSQQLFLTWAISYSIKSLSVYIYNIRIFMCMFLLLSILLPKPRMLPIFCSYWIVFKCHFP
jgi:hypothetical protein